MLRAPTMTTQKTATQLEEEARRRMADQMQVPAARPTAPKPMQSGNTPRPMAFQPGTSLQSGTPKQGIRPAAPQTAVTRIPGFNGPTSPPTKRPPMADPRPAPPAAPGAAAGGTQNVGNAPAPTSDQFDEEARRLLMDRLRKQGDTTEQERVMREAVERELGADVVNQRARMGRAGFGASGAMAALEGDTMAQARQQLAKDIVGVRMTEDQRALDNALRAIGADTDKRRAGTDEAITQAILQMLGMEEPGAGEPGKGDVGLGFVGGRGGIWNPITDTSAETPQRGAGSDIDPKVVDTIPPGATPVEGRPGLYLGTDGHYYKRG